MTMFDEMQVGIHLPIGNLAPPPVEAHMKDMSPSMDHKHMHMHHDEENQYGQRISLPIPR
jgi:hypothetical protein